jgi:hypothetical protein
MDENYQIMGVGLKIYSSLKLENADSLRDQINYLLLKDILGDIEENEHIG